MPLEKQPIEFAQADLASFNDQIETLISEKKKEPHEWLNAYQFSEELRRVIDGLRADEVGIYLITKARSIHISLEENGHTDYMNTALEGFITILRIKAFNTAVRTIREAKDSIPLPDDIEKALPLLAGTVSFNDKIGVIRAVRQLWRPLLFKREVSSLTDAAHNFLETYYESLLEQSRNEKMKWSSGLFANRQGISSEAIDKLMEGKPDMHFYNSASSSTLAHISLLLELEKPYPLDDVLVSVPLLNREQCKNILEFFRSPEGRTYLKTYEETSETDALMDLDSALSKIDKEEDSLSIQVQKALLELFRRKPEEYKLIVQKLTPIAVPNVNLSEENHIPFISISDLWSLSKIRAELLLTEADMNKVLGILEDNRIKTQKPNTDKEVAEAMNEVYRLREAARGDKEKQLV